MSEILETERLLLRPCERRDAAAIAVLYADYDVAKMTARIPHPYSFGDAERYIAQQEIQREEKSVFSFVVARKTDSYFTGMIGLHPGGDALELGYALGKPYWGKGYATEAGRAIVAFGFRDLEATRLVAGYMHDNPASGRVLAKLGFVETHYEDTASAARGATVLSHRMLLTRDAFAAAML